MTTIKAFIKRNPVLTYFIITFVISWGAVLIMIGYKGMPTTKEQLDAQLPVAILAMLGGPSIAGLLMTGLVNGRAGFRNLLSRLLKWRVSFCWYAVALLTGPLVLLVAHLVLSLISPIYVPGIFASDNKSSLLLLGIMGGVMVGICEELGWTGFAIPELRQRYSILTTGLIVGVIWGAWHILSNDVWAIRTYSGALSPALFVTLRGFGFLIGQLPPFRILIVWVYDRTGSLLVAMLMHVGLTASSLILGPLAELGVSVLIYDLALAVAMWVVAAAVVAANGGQLSRQPLPRMAT
jgi:membrane protease YdiL (CAAX protease family)